MGAVQPRADERLPCGRLALGDLVLVVGEDQIDPTGMDVERRAEMSHAHRRAFDVPPRPALPDARRPRRLARLRSLPKCEVTDVVLGVLVGLDTFADTHLLGVEPSQPPI